MNIYDEVKVITHEDIKVVISLKVRCNKEVRKYLNDYIARQEKKDERAKKVEELKDLFMRLANNNFLMYQTDNPIFASKRTILLHEINGKEKELEEMKWARN